MINILIVDDQKHIRDGLQAMLHQFPLELNNIYCAMRQGLRRWAYCGSIAFTSLLPIL
ncbi:hypothetical protein Q0F98_39020 [Paenibacillus amylolyticus]|nr:hypothetical protein Q0F98_39020 [Paenibacillus amylolyticus]